MYKIERNKVVMEDGVFNIPTKVGTISNNKLDTYLSATLNYCLLKAIYTAISTAVAQAPIVARVRQDITYDDVFKLLDGAETATSEYAISLLTEVIQSFKFSCDLSCGNFSITKLEPLVIPSLRVTEEEATSLQSIPVLITNALAYIYRLDKDTINQVIEGQKYFAFVQATLALIDFSTILPDAIEFLGYYVEADSGEGVYEKTDLTNLKLCNNGIYLSIKNIIYKRKYDSVVNAMWFGVGYGATLGSSQLEALLAYGTIVFGKGVVNIEVTEPIVMPSNLSLIGNDTLVNFLLSEWLPYIMLPNAVGITNVSGFTFSVTGVTDQRVFGNATTLHAAYKNNFVNCIGVPSLLLTTTKDITLPNATFNALPLLTRDDLRPDTLAQFGSLPIDDIAKFMTTGTAQNITAKHTYTDITVPSTQPDDVSSNVVANNQLANLFAILKQKVSAKVDMYLDTLPDAPSIGTIYTQFPLDSESEVYGLSPMDMWPNTVWEHINNTPDGLVTYVSRAGRAIDMSGKDIYDCLIQEGLTYATRENYIDDSGRAPFIPEGMPILSSDTPAGLQATKVQFYNYLSSSYYSYRYKVKTLYDQLSAEEKEAYKNPMPQMAIIVKIWRRVA